MLDYSKSFIETQFPVSRISKESYKERKAVHAQTLTSLGKWWGRKPLILVRATILGVLMPVSDDHIKDKEIFLKILGMDESGLLSRKEKKLSTKELYKHLNRYEKERYFSGESTPEKPKMLKHFTKKELDVLQRIVFNRLSYDEKLKYCVRSENFKLSNESEWDIINKHLQTNANSLEELINQIGEKRFNHEIVIGDVFAGGGSIPFESSRIGAKVYASDLNPIASLLTWAALNIYGGNKELSTKLFEFQQKVYSYVDDKIKHMNIEYSDDGMRAENYLYCTEVECPECGYKIPMSSSWVIVKDFGILVQLVEKKETKSYDFKMIYNATKEDFERAKEQVTFKKYSVNCLHCGMNTPIPSIRGDFDDGVERKFRYNTPNNLRGWDVGDYRNEDSDIYTERLYAVRYIDPETKKRVYCSPSTNEINNEKRMLKYIDEHFNTWQNKGIIPNVAIEAGWNTNQLTYEKGWKYWHQMYNPRQILILALLKEGIYKFAENQAEYAIGILGLNRVLDWSSKLSVWDNSRNQSVKNTFLNQALNTLFNYGTRGLTMVASSWFVPLKEFELYNDKKVELKDARNVDNVCDLFITDPPFADAIHYHELTELFLSWDKSLIEKGFRDWYTDSKRVLAIKGVGQSFNNQMLEVYKNLRDQMSDNGYQVVMFTHQDVKVWAELAMILWSAGLQVVSAWNIATETISGLKSGGNYVKGTVLLTLRKQTLSEVAFQDELYDEIKYEVIKIIDSMRDLDDKDEPDFTDADYLLASYASSLKVLTKYKEIEGIDVQYWLSQPRDSKDVNPVEELINKAVRIAYDYLIPEGFDPSIWKDLESEERFYIRGLEVEMSGVYKVSSYQELARGFGVNDYLDMFANFKANSARLKTPSEYRMAFLNGHGFTSTLLRHLLVAIYETTENNKSTVEGRAYLRDVYKQDNEYWYKKPLMDELLTFIANLEFVDHMEHWHEHARSARILKVALQNEGV